MAASYDDLIKKARQKAAEMGADLILVVKATSESRIISTPGYSSFSGYGYGSDGMFNYNSAGYSVGPSVSSVNLPIMQVLVGVYSPARMGINWDEGKMPSRVVKDFHLNSNAPEAGVKIGDVVIGVDGLDSRDAQIGEHMFEIQPGQTIHLTVLRDGKRLEFDVKAIPN